MSIVNLAHWSGGIGNNLEQLVNAYWYAEKTSGELNCIEHHILKIPKKIVFGPNIQDTMRERCFTNSGMMRSGMDDQLERFKSYNRILQKLGPTIFRKLPNKNFNGLIVHIRAGNIYRDPSVGKYLLQAPVSFFKKAMNTIKINKNILFITNTKHGKDPKSYPNPMLKEAIAYCNQNNIEYQISDNEYKNAISYLLNAEHAMITGYTTFSRMLLLSNSNLKSVILPLMGNWPHDTISFKFHGCATHYFNINEHPELWSKDAVIWQKNHPINKIKYIK